MNRKMILVVALQVVFGFTLFAQSGIKNYANIKVKPGTYFAANDNVNFTNTASGSLEIEGAARLEATNTNSAGISGIVVKNGANLLQNSANVNATVEQEIIADKWHLISNPVAPIDMVSVLSGAWLYTYIESYNGAENDDAWANVQFGTLQNNIGYLVKNVGSNRTISYTGILNNGNMTFPLAYTAANGAQAGYNLVGNPFPTALDWTNGAGFDKTNITGAIYIWDQDAVAYGTSNGTVFTAPMTSNIIPANQGFFVKATSASNFVINNNAKTLDLTTPFYKSGNTIDNLLRIRLSGNQSFDELVVYTDNQATQNYDLTKDADKLLSGIANVYTLSEDGYKLAINVTEDAEQTIPMNFVSETSGVFTFTVNEFSFSNQTVTLEDIQSHTFTELHNSTEYTFNHTAGNNANRFVLHFGSVTKISETAQTDVNVYSYGRQVTINNAENCEIEIVDMLGRTVLSEKLTSNTQTISVSETGIYIVKALKNNQLTTKKVFIQ